MTATEPTQRMPGDLIPGEIGLFLDVDGTLLDIAPRPEEVEVKPGLLEDLAAAERKLGGALALVSGRPIAELDRLFAPLRLAAGGIHGAEIRYRPDGGIISLSHGHLDDHSWGALARVLGEFPGTYAENKRVSFAVHYPVPETDVPRFREALSRLMMRIASPGAPMKLVAGHGVFELQLAGFDKGRAIANLMAREPFWRRRPVFIGDDEIDRPGFDQALALGGMAFSVGIDLPGVSGKFSGPGAVREWLHELGR